MGVTIWVEASKSGKDIHLLLIMCVRLWQKIVLLNFPNRTRLKKVNGLKIRTKSVSDYCGIRIILHTPSYYYGHTNVNLLGGVHQVRPRWTGKIYG